MSSAGRDSSSHRVGRGPGEGEGSGAERTEAQRPVPSAGAWLAGGCGPSADVAGGPGLELRPAGQGGAASAGALVGVCRRVDAGSGGGGVCDGGNRRGGGAGPVVQPGGQEPGRL